MQLGQVGSFIRWYDGHLLHVVAKKWVGPPYSLFTFLLFQILPCISIQARGKIILRKSVQVALAMHPPQPHIPPIS